MQLLIVSRRKEREASMAAIDPRRRSGALDESSGWKRLASDDLGLVPKPRDSGVIGIVFRGLFHGGVRRIGRCARR